MYVKPGNYEGYLDYGKTMLARAWGGAKNLLGNVDYALGTAQRIGNVAAPLVAEMAGDRAGSVKARMDATALQSWSAKDCAVASRKPRMWGTPGICPKSISLA